MLKRIIKRADITEEKILTQYQEAFDMAKEQAKPADMVSASTAQAKLVGMLRDRIEAGRPGEFEHLDNVSDVLEALAAQVGPDIARKIGQAIGVLPASDQLDAAKSALADAEAASDAVN